MAKAEKLAKANPSKTVEQHFETVFTDPRYVELAKAAKRPATAMRQQEGKTNVDPQDEDDANDADVDPFDVEDDEADDVIGPVTTRTRARPTSAAPTLPGSVAVAATLAMHRSRRSLARRRAATTPAPDRPAPPGRPSTPPSRSAC
jgi:hypothetical protein